MLLLLSACLVNGDLYYARRAELLDQDGDGHISAAYPEEGGDDCDDGNPGVHPGQPEQPYDGLDNDCDESTLDDDLDGDGYDHDVDCDEDDADINPGMTEVCDGIDNDCDGVDACLPQGQVDVADAPLTLRLDVDEDTVTGANLDFLDFDGDGLDDILIASPLADDMVGRVDVVTGLDALAWGSHDLDEVASLTVSGTGGPGGLGISLAQACDLDGDGFDDAIMSANQSGDGVVYAYKGGPLGAGGPVGLADAAWTFSAEATGGYFGTGLACGRLNDDVAADLVVGEFLNEGGRVWVFSGVSGDQPADRRIDEADVEVALGSAVDAALGREVESLGDLDGDGVGELAIAAPWCAEGAGCVWIDGSFGDFVATGSTTSLTTDDLESLIVATGDIGLGSTVAAASDVDGDGLNDLLVSARDDDYGSLSAWLFTGMADPDTWSRTTDDATASWELIYAGEQLSAECDAGVDVNGDGHADLIIGEQGSALGAANGGAALLYLGGPDLQGHFTDDDAWASMISTIAGGRAGAAVALGADASGDGIGDIAVGVPELGAPGGSVALWWGGPRHGE